MPIVAETGWPGFLSRSIAIAANAATLVVAVLLSVVLVRNYLLPTSSPTLLQGRSTSIRPTDLVTTGTNLSKRLSGVNWNRNGGTLILALSTHCHFCTESAPFFRQIRGSAGKNVKLVGVLPEPILTNTFQAGSVWKSHRATLDVESLGKGFLVMSVTPHKYWRITLDGRLVPAIITNIGYQGIVVPPGRHRIEMQYRNDLVVVGLWISAITLALLIGVLVFYRR